MLDRVRSCYYRWRRVVARNNMDLTRGLNMYATDEELSRNYSYSVNKAKHSYYTERLNLLHWQQHNNTGNNNVY